MNLAVNVFREFVFSWYTGELADIFFQAEYPERMKQRVTSILGGNVTRVDNALVVRPRPMLDILHKKLARRGVDIAALQEGQVQSSGNRASLVITVRQGIDQDTARRLSRKIKETRLKVQASIQGDKIRVTGKKRDDLQSIISQLRDHDGELPLQFVNFRD